MSRLSCHCHEKMTQSHSVKCRERLKAELMKDEAGAIEGKAGKELLKEQCQITEKKCLSEREPMKLS